MNIFISFLFRYLTFKILEGSVHSIFCPATDCFKFVPNEIIEKCVDNNMARRYLQFDIKAFVDSNPNFKWCPNSNCTLAVQSPIFDRLQSSHMREFSKSVNCRNGHYFW
jgi:ankyrin repeat/IBR domain-containing protein 1